MRMKHLIVLLALAMPCFVAMCGIVAWRAIALALDLNDFALFCGAFYFTWTALSVGRRS